MTRPVFPNLVVGRSDLAEVEPWSVVPGTSQRGAASCDFSTRRLTLPLGSTPADRVVRAHELVHLRLSPAHLTLDGALSDISERALTCAEELRVNTVLTRLGFATEELRDGSERLSGERLGELNQWAEAVFFYVALHGTGSAKEYLGGVRKVRPEWAKALRTLGSTLSATLREVSTATMTSTQLRGGAAVPDGYLDVTARLARIADRVAGAQAPTSAAELQQFRRSLQPGGRRPASGRFAPLVLDAALEYEAIQPRMGGRRTSAEVSGTGRPHLERLLTDPQQRIFSRRRAGPGAVVVVDQSGSMDIPEAELEALLDAVPGVTVIGYSHRPGDAVGRPNAWLLANRGCRARSWPTGNVGNGVDGPVLRYAVALRRDRDRIVWVTDGQVTDSNDHPNDRLSEECAQFVRQHQIALVRALSEVSSVLRSSAVQMVHLKDFGRIGRKLRDFG